MTEADKDRIFAEARRTIARVAELQPREVPPREWRSEPEVRHGGIVSSREKPEPREAERAAAAGAEWTQWVEAQLRTQREQILEIVGQALGEALEEIARVIAAKISTLEVALAKSEASVARLRAEVAELQVAIHNKGAVIDLPRWPSEAKH
jgi:hypothetical protein